MALPEKRYTQREIEKARNRGKVVGWVQGAGMVFLAGLVLNALGWIPTVLVLAAVAYVVYKLLSKPPKPEDDDL